MLGWVRTILPSRFQYKSEKRSPNWGPKNLHKECVHPNRWGDKHTHLKLYGYPKCNYFSLEWDLEMLALLKFVVQNKFRVKNIWVKNYFDQHLSWYENSTNITDIDFPVGSGGYWWCKVIFLSTPTPFYVRLCRVMAELGFWGLKNTLLANWVLDSNSFIPALKYMSN